MADSTGLHARLGIIVPATVDLNRGDQSLVWEAASLAWDTGWFDTLAVFDPESDSGESSRNTLQTRELGVKVLPSLLLDPRRGRNLAEDKVRESWLSMVLLIWHSLRDFVQTCLLLWLAPYGSLARPLVTRHQWRTLEAMRRCKMLIVKGGGFLHAWGGIRAPYYIWYQLFYLRLAHRLRIPVCMLPNSFGPFEGWTVRGQIRRVLSRCGYIAARESISARMLAAVLGRPIPVFPDMGYFLPPSGPEIGEAACRAAGVPLGERPCVGITVRPWRFPGSADPQASFDSYLNAFVHLARHIVDRGFFPVFIAQALGPSAHENDNLAIDALVARLGDLPHARINHPGNCSDLKSIYGCMDYVVGTRFHSVIFSQGMGRPSLAVAYGGNKGEGIMRDMQLGHYFIPIEQATGPELVARFDRLVEHADEVREVLARWMVSAMRGREEMLAELRRRFQAALSRSPSDA